MNEVEEFDEEYGAENGEREEDDGNDDDDQKDEEEAQSVNNLSKDIKQMTIEGNFKSVMVPKPKKKHHKGREGKRRVEFAQFLK